MRALRFLATIGFVFAVLEAAVSPSIALNLDKPIPMGKSKKQKELEAREKKLSEKRMEALKKLNALGGGPKKDSATMEALKKLNALGGGPKKATQPKSLAGSSDVKVVIGVASKGMQNKGGPRTSPTGGYDWTTPKTTAKTTNQTLYKPVTSLAVKPSAPAQPQTLYKPVTSLGVKPSVSAQPQTPVNSPGVMKR
jgi:hypothetical protein